MFFSPEVLADQGHTAETDTITQKELDLAQTSFIRWPHHSSRRSTAIRIAKSWNPSLPAESRVSQLQSQRSLLARQQWWTSLEALQKSLAALKKPAASEKPANTNRDAKRIGVGRKKISHNAG